MQRYRVELLDICFGSLVYGCLFFTPSACCRVLAGVEYGLSVCAPTPSSSVVFKTLGGSMLMIPNMQNNAGGYATNQHISRIPSTPTNVLQFTTGPGALGDSGGVEYVAQHTVRRALWSLLPRAVSYADFAHTPQSFEAAISSGRRRAVPTHYPIEIVARALGGGFMYQVSSQVCCRFVSTGTVAVVMGIVLGISSS
jgi:hypothetical protein